MDYITTILHYHYTKLPPGYWPHIPSPTPQFLATIFSPTTELVLTMGGHTRSRPGTFPITRQHQPQMGKLPQTDDSVPSRWCTKQTIPLTKAVLGHYANDEDAHALTMHILMRNVRWQALAAYTATSSSSDSFTCAWTATSFPKSQ